MEKAADLGVGALCMEGNLDFYGKLGFVVASSRGIHYNAEPRTDEVPYFLLRELRAGFLNGVTGTYYTPEGYLVDGRDVENFDAGFSPKKKMKLPGQLV